MSKARALEIENENLRIKLIKAEDKIGAFRKENELQRNAIQGLSCQVAALREALEQAKLFMETEYESTPNCPLENIHAYKLTTAALAFPDSGEKYRRVYEAVKEKLAECSECGYREHKCPKHCSLTELHKAFYDDMEGGGDLREIPILFSTPMVQATQDDRKTMTRRLNNLEEINQEPDKWTLMGLNRNSKGILVAEFWDGHIRCRTVKCPWQPGDRLWVRETWAEVSSGIIEHKAGYKEPYSGSSDIDHIGNKIKWRPSIFMPKVATRIWLEVVNVRVERLQDITEADIIEEGCPTEYLLGKNWFMPLWDSINQKRDYGWDNNPWVWVIEFKLK